ncbi:MAG: hypothetical protein PHD72_03380 [Patescibacteria group bacterium]|nr:hypothetical protein [Patescibacteria group bacterium]
MHKKIFIVLGAVCLLVFTGASCITQQAAVGPMGVFRSADKGEKWTQINALPTSQGVKSISGVRTYRIFDDPSDPNAFYLATRGQGLYYTYNNGDSWQAVPFMNGKFIYALVVDPKDKCTIYASDGPRVYKTIDCARTWEQVFNETRTGERLVALDIGIFDNKKIIWGAELNGDILISRDEGRGWQVVKRFNLQLQDLAVDRAATTTRVYVATYRSGLYRTDDNGATWVDLREGMKKFNDSKTFYRILINPAQKNSLFWVSKYGILRSDDAGVTWTDMKLLTPPGAVAIYGFAVNPKNQKEIYYTGTILGEKNAHINSTFYKSTDGGVTWVTKKLPTNTIPAAIKVHTVNDSVLLMGFTLLN